MEGCECEGPYNLQGRDLRHFLRRLLEDTPDDQGPVLQICLADNSIGWFPAVFCKRHTRTTHLCMHNNKLVALPEELRFLAALQRLCLAGNEIIELPRQIDRMTNLHTINLDGNFITRLPDEVCSLKRLETLSVDCPYLESLPSQIGRLRALKRLNVGKAPLVEYPHSVRYLTNLQSLEIHEESKLWGGVPKAQFETMTVLERLVYLSDRSLKDAGVSAGQRTRFFRRLGGVHGLRAILKFQDGKPLAKDLKYGPLDYKQAVLCGHHTLIEMHLQAKEMRVSDIAGRLNPILAIVQEVAARNLHDTKVWLMQNVRCTELDHTAWRSLVLEGRLSNSRRDAPALQSVALVTYAAATGNLKIFEILQSNRDQTMLGPCLAAAVTYRRPNIVEFLLSKSFHNKQLRSELFRQPFVDALCLALNLSFEDLALRMIDEGVDCFALSRQHSEPPLMYACRNGLVQAVKAIIARCPQPVLRYLEPPFGVEQQTYNQTWGGNFKSLVSVAAAHGHAKIVDILAQNGANVNASSELRDNSGFYSNAFLVHRRTSHDSPLMAAAKNGHVETLQVLLRYGADSRVASQTGITPLMYAIEQRSVEMVDTLLKHGTSPRGVTTVDEENHGLISTEIPLMVAIRLQQVAIVRLLLAAGADPNEAPGSTDAPLVCAASCAEAAARPIITDLLAAGAHLNPGGSSAALATACSFRGRLETVKQLVHAGAIVKSTRIRDDVLVNAARANAYDILIWLIYNGADPSETDLRNCRWADNISTYIINAASRHVAAVGYALI